VHNFFIPGIQGGATSASVLLIIAMVGTTVAPWQLFFQQSNIIDKRITPQWINYERVDTWIGAFVVVIGAAALICVSAFAFAHTRISGISPTLAPPPRGSTRPWVASRERSSRSSC
jgi:Mn2+/Fe2+ NRAMP family transporter